MSEQTNIPYIDPGDRIFDRGKHVLDIYWPAVKEDCPVMVFIHGGTWISGSKDPYAALGRNFAARGIVVAIINYRLGNIVQYDAMAADCAAAVKWVSEHARKYHGDPGRITVSGHSAGAHLAALISLDDEYFNALGMPNPVKACMLIDAFGLHMDSFIRSPFAQSYRAYIEKVFTADPAAWKKASPVSYAVKAKLPFFIITGAKSYPFLLLDNELFVKKLRTFNADIVYEKIPGKDHRQMIMQLEQADNPLYAKMGAFMESKTVSKGR